ncbi:MAG: hypothetical protein K0S65_2119 [Labilithrix sp.]|nr:hypothetical protein [Labilithrix sp.]
MALRGFAIAAAMATSVALPSSAAAAAPLAKTGERANGGETRERVPAEHFRFGPIVGVGFPRPFAIEGLAKIERLVGVGFEYSFLPRMSMFNADTGFKAFATDLRVFPFKGAFFIGARAGRQWLDAKTTLTAGQFGSFTESMAASTWFVNPRAGVLYTFESGITLGIDAGVQIPINPSYERSGRATEAGLASQFDIDGTLVAVANTLGNRTTPTVDLLRLGFLF